MINLQTIPKMDLREINSQAEQYMDYLLTLPKFYDVDKVMLRILYHRGIQKEDDIYAFFHNNLNHLTSPNEMKDADKFCAITKESILNNEDITVYGDYDMDGIGALYAAVKGLMDYARQMGSTSQIHWYANNRFIEGYGITPKGVEDLMTLYPDTKLIITVDNGIVGYNGVNKAKELGLKIIVTDHHKEGKTSVNADAIINPKQHDCPSKFKDLCGAGVIFKLLLKLYFDSMLDETEIYDLVDMVALSTVADLVPLVGDNRIIVKSGISLVHAEKNPHFRVLREVYNSTKPESYWITKPDEETFGFIYGPAFNAVGRMHGDIDLAMEFLFETDEDKMAKLAQQIFDVNEARKIDTQRQNENVVDILNQKYDENTLPKIIALQENTISEGIIGLVAGYLKERFNRPSIIFSSAMKTFEDDDGNESQDEVLKGSARSITGFDITNAFSNVSQYIIQFGGHSAAAGLSVFPKLFDDFYVAINDYADKYITNDMLRPHILIDLALAVEEITPDLVRSLQKLAPYGMGFERPKIGVTNMMVSPDNYKVPDWESAFVGEGGNTVRLVGQNYFTAVMFKHPEQFRYVLEKTGYPQVLNPKPIGYPSISVFNGREKVDFKIESNYLFPSNEYM